MSRDSSDLKSMPLYRDVDRIYNELRAAGLDDRRRFTHGRYAEFSRARRHEEIHGAATVDGLDTFYATLARLFANGNPGGLRLSAASNS